MFCLCVSVNQIGVDWQQGLVSYGTHTGGCGDERHQGCVGIVS
jgi:hypothetical protein